MAKKKVKVGDVFAVPIGKDKFGFGQVAIQGEYSDCIVIYDIVSEEYPPVDSIVTNNLVFLLQTVSSRIEDGCWPVLGNIKVPNNIKYPKYKEETEEGYMLIDTDGSILKENASNKEVENLSELESWSPGIVEEALKAKYMGEDWDDDYNEILYKNV